MAEIWGAAIAAGGAILSGMAASKKAKEEREAAAAQAKVATADEAKWSAVLSQFNKEQDYYYQQLGRKSKQRGLDQFRQFSTVNQFAPNFQGGNNTITLPNKPNITELSAAVTEQEQQAQAKKKGSGGIMGIIKDDAKGELAKLVPGHIGKLIFT